MGIFDEARHEEDLRAHLRGLLYDYAIEHLTTDYVEFTEQAVAELLSQCLHEIPVTDSFSIRLPEEPFDALTRLFSLNNLQSYQESESKSDEVVQYLRKSITTLKPTKGLTTKSQRAVDNDDYPCYKPEERFESLLSRCARRETPQQGFNEFRASLDKPYATFLKSSAVNIKSVNVSTFKELEVKVGPTLNLTLGLTQETATAVKKFIQSTIVLSRPRSTYQNRYLDPVDRPDSPSLESYSHFPMEIGPFIPIFPRKSMPGHALVKAPHEKEANKTGKAFLSGHPPKRTISISASTEGSMSPLRSMAHMIAKLGPVKADDDDDVDLFKENMKIVDGWETYHSSPSSSVTTPRSSQEEVDQLQLTISSPGTELTPIKLLKESRMDLPAMPRSKRFGFGVGEIRDLGSTTTKHNSRKIGAKKSYAAFLLDSLNENSANLTALPNPNPIPGAYSDRSSPILDFDEPALQPGPKSNSESERKVGLKAEAQARVTDEDEAKSILGQSGSTVAVSSTLLPGLRLVEHEARVEGGSYSGKMKVDVEENDFESELAQIFALQGLETELDDPKGFVIKEKLNMKNGKELLMDVPVLGPPNEHSSNDHVLFLTKRLAEHVVPSGSGSGAAKVKIKPKVYQFLRKAKGTQSATLDLSWAPFSVSEPLPCDEEILGVHGDYIDDKNASVLNAFDRMGMTKDQGLTMVSELIERVQGTQLDPLEPHPERGRGSEDTAVDVGERTWREWLNRADRATEGIHAEEDRFKIDIMLSREERRRLAGLGAPEDEKGNEQEDMNERESVAREREMQRKDEEVDIDGGVVDTNGLLQASPSMSTTPATNLITDTNTGEPIETPTTRNVVPGLSWSSLDKHEKQQQQQQYMLYQTETDFGIHHRLPESISSYGLVDDDEEPPGIMGLGSLSSPRAVTTDCRHQGPTGYEYVYHQDHDMGSDKENWDPSLEVHDTRLLPLPHVQDRREQQWDSPSPALQRFLTSYDDDDEFDHRPVKRIRMDWEDEIQGEEPQEEKIDDSGIAFPNYPLLYSPIRARSPGYQQYGYEEDYGRDEDVIYQPLEGMPEHSQHHLHEENEYTPMSTQHQNSNFVPLSFDSQVILDTQSQRFQFASTSDLPSIPPPPEVFSSRIAPSRAPVAPFDIVSIYDHSAGLAEFAKLRAKKFSSPPPKLAPTQSPMTLQTTLDHSASKTAPETIFDKNTLRLPLSQDRVPPASVHWYMTSVNLLQKQALMRSLRSGACKIGLVEREMLSDVDLIIDPHTAVIFTNLLSLPAQIEAFTKTVCVQSWRYDNLLVVFEAFAPSMAFKPDSATSDRESLSAYSPPVLKAIKKFRRDLSLGEACNTKRESCLVRTAFAANVEEAAIFARSFGDAIEKHDVTSGLWGDREWLEVEDEFDEDEQCLAAAEGMNHFAACVILRQVTINELIEIEPEERIVRFGHQVGTDRMIKLNEVIARGKQELQEDGQSSIIQE